PWENHWSEDSEHDPASVVEILALPPGTRMLILSDYCGRWYVSLLTLKSIFEPRGATQLRFIEGSRQPWYFLPGPINHMLYLDSIRYIATVDGNAPTFGKDGKLPCFVGELSRIGGISVPKIWKGIRELEKSTTNPPVLLKAWQMQAVSLWNHFCSGDYNSLVGELRFLLGFRRGYYPASVFLVVAAQRRKLRELSIIPEIRGISFPSDFGASITATIGSVSEFSTLFRQEQGTWRSDLEECFGIRM
ncbi:MAG: hypothetical protein V1909_02045, partial [Candidatus Micrarchaeota archaeon]